MINGARKFIVKLHLAGKWVLAQENWFFQRKPVFLIGINYGTVVKIEKNVKI